MKERESMSIEEKIKKTNERSRQRKMEKRIQMAMAELAYEEFRLEQKRKEDRNAVIIMSLFVAFMLSLKFIF